VGVSHPVL